MSKLRVVPIDFVQTPEGIQPRDPLVIEAAEDFCRRELAEQPDLKRLDKSWLAVELDGAGKLIRPLAISGYRFVPDIPLFRSIDVGATEAIAERISAYFSDQGFRGRDCFLYVAPPEAEPEESRCPNWDRFLGKYGAREANRRIISIW